MAQRSAMAVPGRRPRRAADRQASPSLRPGATRSPTAALGLLLALLGGTVRAATVELELLQPDGTPLPDAVLYSLPADPAPRRAPRPALMDQRDRRFVPHILPIETGAAVIFSNGDSISHHVYSFSEPKRFELYLKKGERSPPLAFDRSGVVAIGCNVHDWMLAYLLVVDTPHFTRTDGAGRADLIRLPAGRQQLVVWHPRITDPAETLSRTVVLDPSATESWTLRLAARLLPERLQEPGLSHY